MNYISILKKCILIIFMLLTIYLAGKLFVFYTPFLIAYIISIIIEPFIKFVCRKTKASRKVSSIIVLVTIFFILAFILSYGIITLISETTNLLSGLNTYLEKSIIFLQDIFDKINFDKLNLPKEFTNITEGTVTNFLNMITNIIKNFLTNLLKTLTSIPSILIYVVITILSTYFITSDKFYLLDFLEYHLSKKMMGKIQIHFSEIKKSLGGYLKAELILILISFIIVLIGLNIFYFIGMNIKYPTLIALLIGFVDALPILGSGTIMIPWGIILLLNKDFSLAFCILGLYIFASVAKQMLEPKIVSQNIGIHPIFTLIAMYTGFKIMGIMGLLLGPIVLIILKSIFSNTIDGGLVPTILDK